MEQEEAIALLKKIESAYPNFLKVDDPKKKARLWVGYLTDMDNKKVSARLDNHIRKSPFEPRVSDLTPPKIEQTSYETLEQFEERIANHDSEPMQNGAYQARLSEVLKNDRVQKDLERKRRLFRERRQSH